MNDQVSYKHILGTVYEYDDRILPDLLSLRQKVDSLRDREGALSPEFTPQLREYFRLKNIYHSNAIEGNLLTLGETRLVIEEGLTISGKPLEDTLEAKNLSHALDFFERLADRLGDPIRASDIRNIHAAILKDIDDENAGKYRTGQVKISGSKFDPPSAEKVPAMMNEFTDWLSKISVPQQYQYNEIDPLLLACATHAWFVYIHPFIDGNGRTARLLMNLVLIRYGYPITIITKDDRLRYYDALEESQAGDLTPLVTLVYESVGESIEVYEQAARNQRALEEVVETVVKAKVTKLDNEYEVFESAMRLLKGYFKQVVTMLNEKMEHEIGTISSVLFKDFGSLDFEKYASLRRSASAKRTWFLRLDFKAGDKTIRFLFFFGYASPKLAGALGRHDVTLHIATEVQPFFYERLSVLQYRDYPTIHEIGYKPLVEKFVCLNADGDTIEIRAEEIASNFARQVFDNLL